MTPTQATLADTLPVPTNVEPDNVPRMVGIKWSAPADAIIPTQPDRRIKYFRVQRASDSGFTDIHNDTYPLYATSKRYAASTTEGWYLRVCAVDAANNNSAWVTLTGAQSPTQVLSPDVAISAVTAAKLATDLVLGQDADSEVAIRAGTGAQIVYDSDGITQYDSDGTAVIQMRPGEKVRIAKAEEITSDEVNVRVNARIRARAEVEQGAVLEILAGVSDPGSKPSLTSDWETLALEDAHANMRGYNWYAGNSRWHTMQESSGIFTELSTAGATIRTQLLKRSGDASTEFMGGVRISTTFYHVVHNSGQWKWRRWTIADTGGLTHVADTQMDIGDSHSGVRNCAYDAVNGELLLGGYLATGEICIWRFNPASLATRTGRTTTTINKTSQTLHAICADPGGLHYWVALRSVSTNAVEIRKVLRATGATVADNEFTTGATTPAGLGHDGTQFWTMGADPSLVRKHTAWDWTTESAVYWVRYAFVDETAGAVTYHTKLSPVASITHARRKRLVITVPEPVTPADRVAIWIERGATQPADASLKYAGMTASVTATQLTLTTRPTATVPVATDTNDFPAATPGIERAGLDSADTDPLEIHGDGRLRLARRNATAGHFTAPVEGDMVYRSDLHAVLYYDGVQWVPLVPGSNPYTRTKSNAVQQSTSSTTYVDGGTPVETDGVTIPASLRIICIVSANMDNGTAGARTMFTAEVRSAAAGAGSVLRAAADDDAAAVATTSRVKSAEVFIFIATGTGSEAPGSTVYFRGRHKVTAGTGQIYNRTITCFAG